MTQIYDSPTESSTTDQAKEKAQAAAGQAKEKAGSQLRSQVDQRSTDAGHRVGGIASDVRAVGESLREQGKDQPAKLAEQAADRAERLGSYLKQADGEAILRDVEDFGRRQPWAVMFGGLAAGFLASRFLKASSSRRAQTGYQPSARPQNANGTTPPAPATPPATGPGAPVTREPGPSAGRPAENVSLTGGVLPPQTPGATRPGGAG